MKRKFTLLFVFLLLPVVLLAQGRIKGKITDLQTGEPLIGANVIIIGTNFGAATDENGDFVLTNLNSGTYDLKASYIGYQTVTVNGIRVSQGLTTERDFQLPPEGITVETVEVTAERPLVNKSNTNAIRITTGEDIEALPVRGINNIIGLTAGVVLKDNTVFIRGGRLDEVGYYVEGVNVTNPVTGGRGINIPQDAVEEIQVQAGGYTAEFGGANAGIIKQQLKTGAKVWQGSVEYITDNIGFKPEFEYGSERLGTNWYGYNEMIATLGGPVFSDKFRFFGLFNYNFQRDQNPQPYPGINIGNVADNTSQDTVNLVLPAGAVFGNSAETYAYSTTFTMDFNPLLIRFAGTYSQTTSDNSFNSHRNAGTIANILNTDRIEKLDQNNGSASLKMTYIFSNNLFVELNGGYFINTLDRYDPYLEDNFLQYGDSAANAAAGFTWARNEDGPFGRYLRPDPKTVYIWRFNAPGEILAGYQKAKRENFSINGALSWVMNKVHNIKLGGEMQYYTIRNYAWGNEGVFALAGLLNDNANLPDGDPSKRTPEQILFNRGVNAYGYDAFGNEFDGSGIFAPKHPLFAAFYVQDKIEFQDLIINAGLRFDHINSDNKALIDPSRPELTFPQGSSDILEEGLVDVPAFNAISPRIGLSFPVTDQTVFHAQYGKFVQQTRLNDMYLGLPALAGNIRGGFFINTPVGFDLRPTRTTQYEIGFTQQVGDFASFDITGYYKDIKDQVVYDLQTTSTPVYQGYTILTNGDFATTKGLEITFNMRRVKNFAANASLSFQDARGTGSYPNSNRGIVGAPLDGVTIFKPAYISPLEYNNAISGNFNLDYRFGIDEGNVILQGLGASLLGKFTSGHPFTRGVGGADLEGDARDRRPVEPLNSSVTPATLQFDLRVDKSFKIVDRLTANVYLFVINLFDRRNVENVFLRTGTTTDDGWLSDPANKGKYSDDYINMYNAIYIDYYQLYQNAPALYTAPYFYSAPRQIRLGIKLEY